MRDASLFRRGPVEVELVCEYVQAPSLEGEGWPRDEPALEPGGDCVGNPVRYSSSAWEDGEVKLPAEVEAGRDLEIGYVGCEVLLEGEPLLVRNTSKYNVDLHA